MDRTDNLLNDDLKPKEILASRLVDAWVNSTGKPISWNKCIEINLIVGAMTQEEADKLQKLYGPY